MESKIKTCFVLATMVILSGLILTIAYASPSAQTVTATTIPASKVTAVQAPVIPTIPTP
jgi:hypothetical protein